VTLKAVPPKAPAAEDRPPAVPTRATVDARSAALTVLAVLGSILALQYAQAMIIPIVLGVLVSYALEPMVAALTRWRLPRPLAAAIVLVAITATGGLLLSTASGPRPPTSSRSCPTARAASGG
jgi:predicted PurR-regulated permease PerM